MVTIRNKRPLGQNVSTSAVSLPNFIVIKVPETVAAPHISVALSLPWFLSVPHPSKYSHFVGKKKPRASVNVFSQGPQFRKRVSWLGSDDRGGSV